MLSSADILHIPYTPELTETGIAHALRSLPFSLDRVRSSSYDRLRHAVANVAVELAFRRYLSQENIPFEVQGTTPFTDPHRYDVLLGGHRCELKSYLISQREKISAMQRNPEVMLDAAALVSSDQHAGSGHTDHDLYIFAFLSGLIAASRTAIRKVTDAGQPHYLLHMMDAAWRKPSNWNPLGPLALKSESDEEMFVELSGEDASRDFVIRAFSLPPRTKVVVDDPFYSIAAVHVRRVPIARLGIHSPARKVAYVIGPADWGNIWVDGMDIFLAGYISRQEFRQRARSIPPNSRVFQCAHTNGKNLAVPVSHLGALHSLFENVRRWDERKTQ